MWLEPLLRRATTWLPWAARFEDLEPVLDPTFFTRRSLDDPPGWVLEGIARGVRVLHDPVGELAGHLSRAEVLLESVHVKRRLFMGLPFYESVGR